MRKRFLLLLGILTVVITLAGCGKSEITLSGDNGESITFDESGGNVTVTTDQGESVSYSEDEDGNVSITGEDEDGESFSMNSGTEIPKELPKEIPFPDKYVVTSAFNMSESTSTMVSVTYEPENASLEEIQTLYKDFAESNNYTSEFEYSAAEIYQLNLVNNDQTLSVTVEISEDSPTVVTLMYILTKE